VDSSDYADFPVGSYADALAMVGHHDEPMQAEVPVEIGQIRALAALVQDANPCFWDEESSDELWGAQVAPAAILQALFQPYRWHPEREPLLPLGARVPLPGATLINVRTENTFLRPLRLGDRLTLVERVDAVSPEKSTRLGVGHFVTTVGTFRDAEGSVVAEGRNILFRFTAHADGAA
jgi:acyl dehydratase